MVCYEVVMAPWVANADKRPCPPLCGLAVVSRACTVAGFNYFQSVTPWLALGGETFWLGQQRKSGTGFAARLHDDKSVATAQVASTGVVSLTYVHRVSEKVRHAACGACGMACCTSIATSTVQAEKLSCRVAETFTPLVILSPLLARLQDLQAACMHALCRLAFQLS